MRFSHFSIFDVILIFQKETKGKPMLSSLYTSRKSVHGNINLKRVSTSTMLVLEEAEKLGVDWELIPQTGVFKLTYQGKSKSFYSQVPSTTTACALHICRNKPIAKNMLEQAGFSVTNGYIIKKEDSKQDKIEMYKSLIKPLVVKPVDEALGNNVYVNISTQASFLRYVDTIFSYYGKTNKEILVEEMFVGQEYRILAIKHKILGVIRTIPANIVGDGVHAINELIADKNTFPFRGKTFTVKPIQINQEVSEYLDEQSLTLESVPAKSQRVFLRVHSDMDITYGGDTIDVTDSIHPSVSDIALGVINAIPGLSLVGIDFMSKDITVPQTFDSYKIIEINTSPALDWNTHPVEGPVRNVPFEFLKIMFPTLTEHVVSAHN